MVDELLGVLGTQPEELQRTGLDLFDALVARLHDRDEDTLPLGLDPSAVDLVVSVAFLALPAIDHEIVEQIVVAGTLPDLRMHDDRAIEADHLVGPRCPRQGGQIVMAGDHVSPPGVLEVAFQFDAERAVVPEAVEATVDFARLEDEAPTFAQGDQLVHVLRHRAKLLLASVGRQPHESARRQWKDLMGLTPHARLRQCPQWRAAIPTAPISTRHGSRRNSGTRVN